MLHSALCTLQFALNNFFSTPHLHCILCTLLNSHSELFYFALHTLRAALFTPYSWLCHVNSDLCSALCILHSSATTLHCARSLYKSSSESLDNRNLACKLPIFVIYSFPVLFHTATNFWYTYPDMERLKVQNNDLYSRYSKSCMACNCLLDITGFQLSPHSSFK